MTTVPTDANIKWLVADDVRQEMGGKLSIMGYYPGDKIQFAGLSPSPNSPIAIESLCLLWVFNDGLGDFPSKLSVFDPNNQQVFATSTQQLSIKQNGGAVLIIKLSPFLVSNIGKFECLAEIDGSTFRRHFEVTN